MLRVTHILFAIALVFVKPAGGQIMNAFEGEADATIIGTVTDVNGDPVPNSKVVLKDSDNDDSRSVVTLENGFFEFHDVKPGVACEIRISAQGFADWTSSTLILRPGQFKIVAGVQLRIRTGITAVQVHYDPVQVATAQLTIEEQQRVLGFIPNFYVSYEKNPVPLTAKMKFQLAFKVATDPVTAAGVAVVAASKQGGDTPSYGQGWGAYGKRFGAVATDGFSDIMIGGGILPSLLHQDPRYFYQGGGTTASRIRHAMFSAFIAKGDNAKWQPNYSTMGGDLASAGIANLYYPRSDRGGKLVFGNFALGTTERISANLVQEFILGRLTKRSRRTD